MQFYNAILLALLVASTSAALTKSGTDSLKWKSCPHYTVTASSSASRGSSGEEAECVVYDAPLCHPGICETPKGVDPTIEVFVKRLPASTNPKTARNVWLFQDELGISSASLESTMVSLHARLKGDANVYLMDHRGTGRSTRLHCSAENAINGSVWSTEVEPSAVGDCAVELASKYGDLAAFSITSAASDVAYFIAKHTNGEETIVYGSGYGTTLGERLMHLNPPSVTGYVLDGIASTGAPANEFPYYSKWDTDFGEVGDRFLALCEEDEEISSHFKKRGLSGTIQNLFGKSDKDSVSTCLIVIGTTPNEDDFTNADPLSFGLRRTLGKLMSDADKRKLIPPVVYRTNHCADKDINVLLRMVADDIVVKKIDGNFQSPVLNNLITFSELWEKPTPSEFTLKKRFTDELISAAGVYNTAELYCAFTKEKSKTCNKFKVGNYDADPIVYERDEYWGKRAVIPSQASVLLLSSKLDVQTPHKYAEYMLDALKGDNKELITFEYATHGMVQSTHLVDGDTDSVTCGMTLLASFVKNGGDLEELDKSCVDKMPGFNMTIPKKTLQKAILTTEAYDGKDDGDPVFWGVPKSSSDDQSSMTDNHGQHNQLKGLALQYSGKADTTSVEQYTPL